MQAGDSASSHGANVTIAAGLASSLDTSGGSVNLISGQGFSGSGSVNIATTDAVSGMSGDVTLAVGNGLRKGGNVVMSAGNAASGAAGEVLISAGSSGVLHASGGDASSIKGRI